MNYTPDVIGTLYEPTGVMLTDAEGEQYPEMQAIPGFHVNFPVEVPELAAYKTDPQPVTPHRVYAGGGIPVAYTFPDEPTFTAYFPEGQLAEPTAEDILQAKRDKMVVTMRQARLALHQRGLLGQVAAAIAAMPEPDSTNADIEWNHSQTVERNRAFVLMLGPALGLDDSQLDDLFALAETL